MPRFPSTAKVFNDLECSKERIPFVTCRVASECPQFLDGFFVLGVDHELDILELHQPRCQAPFGNDGRPEHVMDRAKSSKMRAGIASLTLELAGQRAEGLIVVSIKEAIKVCGDLT